VNSANCSKSDLWKHLSMFSIKEQMAMRIC